MSIPTTSKYACFDYKTIPRLGLGCWAIGGPFSADGKQLGYGEVNDDESSLAIHAAVDNGIRYFDTAGAYGAGHSEHILGEALAGQPDVYISTKIGLLFDEKTRTILGESGANDVSADVDASLRRLHRDQIDLLFLHLNSLPVPEAEAIFEQMDRAVETGKIRAYGWSTDFASSVEAVASIDNLVAIQHAMNVFFSAPDVMRVLADKSLLSVSRSPLAMGLLTGKYNSDSVLPSNDIRSNDFAWNSYFMNGRVRKERLMQLDQICECLKVGGRTAAQGALCWLWAHSDNTIPIAGFRNIRQVEQNVAALEFGALPQTTMNDIEQIVDRIDEDIQRER